MSQNGSRSIQSVVSKEGSILGLWRKLGIFQEKFSGLWGAGPKVGFLYHSWHVGLGKGLRPQRPRGGATAVVLTLAPSLKAAERDWEEKRAALTQYSAKDINRLLEETQAELLKAIPDLDCASKAHPAPTPDHKPPKVPHGQKAAPRTEPSGRRGSGTGEDGVGEEPEKGSPILRSSRVDGGPPGCENPCDQAVGEGGAGISAA